MLAELLRARAAAEPDAEAFAVADAESLTYGSWQFRSDSLCRGLLAHSVAPGDRVVLYFDARGWIDFAVAYAGVHKAGAVPVVLGPQVPTTALVRAVAHSGASGVVTSSPPVGPEALGEMSAWVAGPGELEDTHAQAELAATPASELAHIAYRFRPLQAFRPTSSPASELLAAVDDVVDPAGEAPFLHAFHPVAESGSRALWMPLGRHHRPVVVLPTLDPDVFCALTAAYGAACWGLASATAGWLLDSGALQRHDVASIVRLIVLDGQGSPALRARLAAHLPAASVFSSFFARSTVSDAVDPKKSAGGGDEVASVPVASSQEGMLWHEVFAPGSQNLPPLVRRYRGALDVVALERALAEIVRRHEPLRTTFEVRDGRPVQIVSPVGDWDLGILDLSGLDPDAQDDDVASLLAAVGRPFDLVRGPMFEATLVRLGPDDHLVVLRVHHSVYDGWSVGVFRQELSTLYQAFAAGEPSPLAELPISFADFSLRQHERLAGSKGAAELAWWKEHLAGAPLSLQLPIDDPERPPGAPQASAEPVSVDLGPELSAQLRALARRERTTLFMTLLTAFQVLVQRYTGQEDLLAASVVANRNRPELEAMVGCFTKKVLVRLDGSGDPAFADLLPQVRTAVVGALGHQDLPFETVLQGTLGADAAMHGLVPQAAAMFQGVTPHREEVLLPGLETTGYDTSETTTRTHFSAGERGGDGGAQTWGAGLYLGTFLILSVIENVETVSLAARGAFHGPSAEQFLATFRTLLADIVAHPTKRISELRLLGDGERAELTRCPDGGEDLGHGNVEGRVVIGRRRPGLEMAVFDRRGALVPERVTGELHLGGRGEAPKCWFGTGTLARYLPAGRIELLGSTAEAVELRGFRIDRARIAEALRFCPGVADIDIVLEHDAGGQPRFVAGLVAAEGADAPNLVRLRAELWARLPGYAWPAAIEVAGRSGPGERESPDARVLASLWAEALGVERIEANENYWQSFSFLEAVSRARELGVAVSDQDITRNRTIATLATTLAAGRLRHDNDGRGNE